MDLRNRAGGDGRPAERDFRLEPPDIGSYVSLAVDGTVRGFLRDPTRG